MASFIAIPLKKTNEVDLVKPLKNLFSSYCISADEPVQYDSALTELNKLRMNSTWRTLDKHESSLDVMTKYYDQLTFLETKCPSVDFPVPFKWKDAFDKGTFFSASASLTVSSLIYERICILFNVAAMQSQIAVGHGMDTHSDEGLKLAAKYFQLSSGTFQHLKTLVNQLHQDPTPDLQPDTLTALQTLMLAQAQESFLHKAISDQMKDAIIAKVAGQCDELYGEALKLMSKEATRVIWEKEWLAYISGKQVSFQALTQYYQSLVCKGKKEVGEEIARLQSAGDLLKLGEVRGGPSFTFFKDYVGRVSYAYDEAKKDNDFIYHARIPDVKSLAPIGRAALAKPTAVGEKMNPNSQDLFVELLPMPVQQALQAFDTRKIDIVSEERAAIQNSTQLLNGMLASLNLPASLEDTTGCQLPQSLRDKAEAIRSKGGIAALQRKIDELPDFLQRNREILSECEKMLNEEEESDTNLRNQFKSQWTRTPSAKLNDPLRANVEKHRKIIGNATDSDATVRQKFNQYSEKIILLSRPEDELLSQIPEGSPTSNSSSAADQLRGLMNEVTELLHEREMLKDEMESATTDMKAKFLSALTQDGGINEQALSVETIGVVYGPIQKRIRENMEKQDTLLRQIKSVNDEFCSERQGGTGRDAMLSELATAHDHFMELSDNVEEGTKFYNYLTQVLVQFQSKISDFCFARKTEREEFCKEIQSNVINDAKTQPAPKPPASHNQNQKPARPPPPTVPASAAAAQPPYPYPGAAEGQGSVPPYPTQPVFPTYPTPMYYPPQFYPPVQTHPYTPTGYMNPQQPPQPQQGQYQPPAYPQQQYYHQYYPQQ